MTINLERLGALLRAAPPECDLSRIEQHVWCRIHGGKSASAFGIFPEGRTVAGAQTLLGALVLAGALMTGAVVAAYAEMERSELAVFFTSAPMAPSTLLSLP